MQKKANFDVSKDAKRDTKVNVNMGEIVDATEVDAKVDAK